jgi:hypothetical protein
MTRFPIRYSFGKGLILRSVLVLQRWSYIDVGDDVVRVRMAYGFAAKFRRRDIAKVSRGKRVWVTAGVHGWRGRWLVNGASGPIVAIEFDAPVRAFVLGFPVKLRELQVSVADPDEFVRCVAS